jgi:HEAT repeats/PBS lyase HEAT-like repeat
VRANQANLAQKVATAASFESVVGRNPDAELRAAETVTRELWKAVQAFTQDAVSPESVIAFESLSGVLVSYLDKAQFLWLHVTPQGFRVHRSMLSAESRPLARHLARSGILEILFKRGIGRYELERCVAALHETPVDGVASVATRLWEAGLPNVVFRCKDELLGPDDARGELESWRAHWPQGSAAAEHDALVRDYEATNVDTTVSWQSLTSLTAADRTALQRLRLAQTEALVERLARHLAALHDHEREAVRRGESLGLLGDVVEMLLAQRKFPLLHDMLAALRDEKDGRTVSEATLDHVVQRLCTESNVMVLGAILEGPGSRPEDVKAVRSILHNLPGAIDPLCRLLVRLEGVDARRLTCRVLAYVAKEDPKALAQRANGQPWYLARNVAYVLGRIGGTHVLPFLRRWLHHEDERVRMEVARALGRVQEHGAVSLLGEMLDDESWRVRQSAVWSLAELGDPRALPRLRGILFEDRGFRARRSEERDDFFRTYGRLADASAFTELVRVVEQRQILTVGWQAELRRGAVLALGETGRPDALHALHSLERARDARLRDAVADAVRNLHNRAASLQTDDDPRVIAARVLRARRGESAFHLEFAEEV